jgi:cytochrome c553
MKTALLLVVALVGCAGEIVDDSDKKLSEGQRMFASTVQPMLRACAGCHEGAGSGPPFLGQPGAEDDYTAILANARVTGSFDPTTALLINKGSHQGITWWSSSQQSTIEAWMHAEATNGTPGAGATDIMAAWVGCMTLENWDDSMMGEWANKRTDDNATCGGCHADGEYGMHVNPTSDIMFAQQRTAAGISSFFQAGTENGQPAVMPAIDKLRGKCSGANLHPSCAVDDQYVEYLKRFTALTRTMMEAGLCKPPGYKNLTDPL